MLDRIMTTCFKNIEKACDVCPDIIIRMSDTVPHAHLCGKIKDILRRMLIEDCVHKSLVGYITLDKYETRILSQRRKTIAF